MKYLFSLVLTLLLARAYAQNNTGLLEGTIGNNPVVMNLNFDDSTSTATYFYKAAKKDIQLTGTTVGVRIFLYAEKWNPKTKKTDTSETIILKQIAKNTFTGTWENSKQEQLDVSMMAADINNVQNRFSDIPYVKALKKDDPYNYMRTAAMKLVSDSTVKMGRFTFDYVHVEHSNVNLFRVTGNDAVTGKINEQLDNVLIENAAQYFSCSDFKYRIRSMFVHDDIISVDAFAEYYCGGVHPDFSDIPVNINAKTGDPMVLEDILYLGDGKIPAPESDEWLAYRHDTYAPTLLKLLKENYPKHMKDKEPCDYTQDYIWPYAKWYLTEEGLRLLPEFPHVMAICSNPEWSVIPYKTLKKYRNPKSEISLP